jgi:hypothetical protein
MSLDWHLKPGCCALGAVIVLAASAALANDFAEQTPVQLAADSPETMTQTSASTMAGSYPPIEAGVRRAAAQGPDALRRYIWRTRMIYNYNFWDFVQAT